jgi:hypothetical protein
MKSLAPDFLTPGDRIIFLIKEADLTLLLQQEQSAENYRNQADANHN